MQIEVLLLLVSIPMTRDLIPMASASLPSSNCTWHGEMPNVVLYKVMCFVAPESMIHLQMLL